MLPLVSLIVPIYNEENYITNFFESLFAQEYPMEKLEILLVDGGSTDNTVSLVERQKSKTRNLYLLNNPNKTVPYALNLAIAQSTGDVIIRLDVHSSYPSNYIETLVKILYETKADNVGAGCVAIAKNNTTIGNAISGTLSSSIGIGNSLFRLNSNKNTIPVDTVPFGCFLRGTFTKYGLFNEKLDRNQDLEFNKRIVKAGGVVLLHQSLQFDYYCRETFSSFANQNFRNGFWNILTVYYINSFSALSLRHLAPLFFVLFIFLTSILGFFYDWALALLILSVLIYLIIILFESFRLAKVKGVSLIFIIIAFLVLHFSYGIGSLAGIAKVFSLKISSVE